jgi:hypothetical protein
MILLLLLILCTVLCSLDKKCQNIAVGSVSCDPDYETYSDATPISDNAVNSDIWMNHEGNYRITDTIVYNSVFWKKPYENLNFDDWIVIGIIKLTNPGSELIYKTKVCINSSAQKLKLKVSYSLYDQCRGSGIDNHLLSIWLKLPKSFASYDIEYDLRDVNPFPK